MKVNEGQLRSFHLPLVGNVKLALDYSLSEVPKEKKALHLTRRTTLYHIIRSQCFLATYNFFHLYLNLENRIGKGFIKLMTRKVCIIPTLLVCEHPSVPHDYFTASQNI